VRFERKCPFHSKLICKRIEVGADASDIELVVDPLDELVMREGFAEKLTDAEFHARGPSFYIVTACQ
jgi:hypothetical protein